MKKKAGFIVLSMALAVDDRGIEKGHDKIYSIKYGTGRQPHGMQFFLKKRF